MLLKKIRYSVDVPQKWRKNEPAISWIGVPLPFVVDEDVKRGGKLADEI